CRSGQLAAVRRIAHRPAAAEDPVDRYPAWHTRACHSGLWPAYPVALTAGADQPDGLPVRRPAHHCHSRSVLDCRLLGIAGNTSVRVLESLAVNYRARGYCTGGGRCRQPDPCFDGDDGGAVDCRIDENCRGAADHFAADHSASCGAAACPLTGADGTGSQHHRLPVRLQRTAAVLYAGYSRRPLDRRLRLRVLPADLPDAFFFRPPATPSIGVADGLIGQGQFIVL